MLPSYLQRTLEAVFHRRVGRISRFVELALAFDAEKLRNIVALSAAICRIERLVNRGNRLGNPS